MSDERTRRNTEVFGGAAAAMPSSASVAEMVKAEFGLDQPVETVPLPSNGLVYPVNSSLHGKSTVEITAMTTREEDILTNKVLLKKGTVVSSLLTSCLVDKTIDPSQLLAGDRNALLVAIRVTGYGHEYDADVKCSNDECLVTTQRQFDLSKLPINRLTLSPVRPGENLFAFTLPHTKKVVNFKFMTGTDEEDSVATEINQKKLNLPGATASQVTTSLFKAIVSIDGNVDRSQIQRFVQMMPAGDSLALRNYIRDNEPGIQMRQQTQCSVCDHVEEVSIPMGVTFLYPGFKS